MNNIYKDKEIFNKTHKANNIIEYLIGTFLILALTVIIFFFTPILGRSIISGYILLLVLISFLQKTRVVLFMALMIFWSYAFLFFVYPYEKIFCPILDFSLLFLSAGAVVFITNNIQKHHFALSQSKREAEYIKSSLEIKVVNRTKELKELSQNLEKKVHERTKAVEKTRRALVNLLEDAEYSKNEIEEERNKTRAALISLSDGLIVFNREEKITLINPEAEKILCIKESDALNKRINEIDNVDNLNALYDVLGKKIKWTKKRYKLVLDRPTKKFFQVSIARVEDKEDDVGLMIILHDVTREEEIDQMKTEFISVAAHQLRTPLAGVKWSLRMILDGDMGKIAPEASEYLKKSYQSNERMINLVNNLLNVSHIEEGGFVYNLESVSLRSLIQDVISDSAELALKNKIKVKFNKSKNKMPEVKIDFGKMKMAIQNLIDNAIKYSTAGKEVVVSLKQKKEGARNFIQIEIKDNGIGISKKDQKRMFVKFTRGDNAIKLQTEGSGLGLFIVRNIIEAHHGKVWFDSEKNKGTTLYVKLPV